MSSEAPAARAFRSMSLVIAGVSFMGDVCGDRHTLPIPPEAAAVNSVFKLCALVWGMVTFRSVKVGKTKRFVQSITFYDGMSTLKPAITPS